MSSRPNPLSIQLFSDPRLRQIDQKYLQDRQDALDAAQHVETTSMTPENQAQATTMRRFDAGGQRDVNANPWYSDTANYPVDQSILNLPQANAAAQARRTASIAMLPKKGKFTL